MVVGLAVPAFAQPARDEALTRQINEQITRLDALDLRTRDEAARVLSDVLRIDLDTIERALTRADLSPEQRVRLEQLGIDAFRAVPKAGMGVQFARQQDSRGVRIEQTVEGFPAAKVLQPGDVIISFAGRRVNSTERFSHIILSHEPGAVVPAVIMRGEDELAVDIPLGRFADLAGASSLDPFRLAGAFRERLARLGIEPPAVAGEALSEHRWAVVELGLDEPEDPAPLAEDPATTTGRVVAGGQARMERSGAPQWAGGMGVNTTVVREPSPLEELRKLSADRLRLVESYERVQRRLNEPAPQASRDRLAQHGVDLQTKVAELDARIAELREQLSREPDDAAASQP